MLNYFVFHNKTNENLLFLDWKTFLLMKGQFKQRWSTIPPISTKRIIPDHLKLLNIKKTTANAVGNSGPDLRQAHECDRLNRLLGSQPPFLANGSSYNGNTDINKQ